MLFNQIREKYRPRRNTRSTYEGPVARGHDLATPTIHGHGRASPLARGRGHAMPKLLLIQLKQKLSLIQLTPQMLAYPVDPTAPVDHPHSGTVGNYVDQQNLRVQQNCQKFLEVDQLELLGQPDPPKLWGQTGSTITSVLIGSAKVSGIALPQPRMARPRPRAKGEA